tara:strand:- start:135 stop:1271 length:1137 start_codon:yes stop_codon:yes gene_type:complete
MFIDHNKLSCPLSGDESFEQLFKIENHPIFMGVVDQEYKSEHTNMVFHINKNTGSVQIYPRVPLEKLYFKSHGSGKIGSTWKNHHEEFYKFIAPFMKGNIVEIGGGHNSIHLYPPEKSKNFNVYSFDPNSKTCVNKQVKVINKFFSEHNIKEEGIENINMFIHSHLFEHIYDPSNFLDTIHNNLNDGGFHIFAVPNMSKMIELNYANAMNFEHPFFLSEDIIEHLLSLSGFKIIEKKYFQDAHSIFYKTQKTDKIHKLFKNQYNDNREKFLNLIKNWKNDVNNINLEMKNHDGEIYVFGAHIFSQNLIVNGLDSSHIRYILDNDPDKQNQVLYGTSLEVKNPNIIKENKNPLIILRAAAYNNEIKEGIISINRNSKFL